MSGIYEVDVVPLNFLVLNGASTCSGGENSGQAGEGLLPCTFTSWESETALGLCNALYFPVIAAKLHQSPLKVIGVLSNLHAQSTFGICLALKFC